MDGIQVSSKVFVVGATNRVQALDDALLRPGRFDQIVYVPPPDLAARVSILKLHMSKMPVADDVAVETIAEETESFTGAELESLCREAAMTALRANIRGVCVTKDNFRSALRVVRPSKLISSHIG